MPQLALTRPLIVGIGTLEALLPYAAYTLLSYTQPLAAYIPFLAQQRPALIVVDVDQPHWQTWVTTPKVDAATRRLPVLCIGTWAEQEETALLAGADGFATQSELRAAGQALLAEYARPDAPAVQAALECDCQAQRLPPLGEAGLAYFNAGEYYRQHDAFEALWRETTTPVRDLYRAILQVGVAYYQIQRGNRRGARKMLLRAQQWLLILPDTCQGVDVQQFRVDAARVRVALTRLPDDTPFDASLLRPVRYTPAASA